MDYLQIVMLIVISFGNRVQGQGANTCFSYPADQRTVCLHRTTGNKASANATIQSHGYPLEILDESMTAFLENHILLREEDAYSVYWIGLSKVNSIYTWEHSGATTDGYSNWASIASQTAECVVLSGADRKWVDRDCSFTADGFIYVQNPTTSAPVGNTSTVSKGNPDEATTAFTTNLMTTRGLSEGSTRETSETTDTTITGTSILTVTTSPSITTTVNPEPSKTAGQRVTSDCVNDRATAPPIEEQLPNASISDVNTIVQNGNLTSNGVLLVQEWFEENNVLSDDVGDPYEYTKEYLDTFDRIITSSDEGTFEVANPAVFADACNNILEQLAQRSNGSYIRIILPNIESELVESPVMSFNGYSSDFEQEKQNKSKNSYIAIQDDWVKNFKDDSAAQSIEIIGTLYNTSQIAFGNDDDNEIVSSMISLTVFLDGEVTSLPVEFGLELNQKDNNKVAKEGFKIERTPACVFWDSSGVDGSGLWKPTGCVVVEASTSYVKCSCEHTTNFAILMQTTEIEISEAHESALSTLSLIGLGVSTVALILTILILLCLPSLKSDRVFIHKHLVVALIFAQSFFLSTVAAINHELSCKLVAISLHYFYLAVFMWMLIEGVHLYLEIVQVFSRFDGKSKTAHYIIGGWGIPLIIVAISVGIRWESYGTGPGCWLSFDDGLIWAFLGPVCLVITINFIILLMVVRVVFRASASRGKDKSEYQHLTAALKGALFLLPLLGLTWVIGFMSVSRGTLVFQYLFVVFNSLQGLFIFLFYCAMNKEVRGAISRRLSRAGLESGDSKSISLRAVAKMKTTKSARTSPVIRFHDTSNDTSGIHSLGSRIMDDDNPVSASGIRMHPKKSESQQNLTRDDENRSPFSPEYE